MQSYINLASDSVIWEMLGGQIVTANMETGMYCNVEAGSGVVIWHLLLAGLSVDEVVEALKSYYETTHNIQKDILRFIQQLEACKIWAFSENTYVSADAISINITDYTSSKTYASPRVLNFNDIDTLLQIDPIDEELYESIEAK